MEIGEICIRIDLSNVDVDIANGMSSVNDERNAFLFKEGLKSIKWEDNAGH